MRWPTEKVPLNLLEVIPAQKKHVQGATRFFLTLPAPSQAALPLTQRKVNGFLFSTTASANTALTPLPASDRLFSWRDHAALWLSLGVDWLVMQIGAYLVPALGPDVAL